MWNIKDKICLITGATSGIGRETALALARMGANVIITFRDHEKADATREYIYKKTEKNIEAFFCDFSSFESIRNFVKEFLANHDRLHVLINNAGIYEMDYKTGKDGIELNWTVNHLAPFLLTSLLLDTLKKSSPARIVNVASESHRNSSINFNDIELKKDFSGKKAYEQSKLANVLFTKQLSRELAGTDVTANCLHPGIVKTNIFSKMNRLEVFLFKLIMISPAKGAKTSVFLASSPDVEGVSGEYFKKKKIISTTEYAGNSEIAKKLWQISTKSVDLLSEIIEENPTITKYYSNGEITVVWKPDFCTHVAYCFMELPEVFDVAERPWINPYGATTEKIINQVKRCPTNALTFYYNDQQDKKDIMETEKIASKTRIEIIANGPAMVKGVCILIDKDGKETETAEVFSICRCGKSERMPWCDGKHIGHPFE